MSVDPELLREFLLESREVLQRLDRDLVELEKSPTDGARLKEIFRSLHTVKGTSSFLALHRLERLAHAGESLMDRLRDGVLSLDAEMTSALLAMVDAIRNMVGEVEASGTDGDEPHDALVGQLLSLAGEPLETEAAPSPTFVSARKSSASEVISKADAVIAISATPQNERTLRVDVGLLDHLMKLIEELGAVRNQLVERTAEDDTLAAPSQQLDRLTTELHQSLLKTRVQAIGTVWNRFPRIVRDLAIVCGKQVEVELRGTATELDRSIIEAIKDPLTHLVRNSVDHGLEAPEVRVASGKPPTGRLRLDAYHVGTQLNLEVTDDGSGINLERVRHTALERKLVSPEALAKMADHEVMQLIFAPGFSTAKKVTTISGRGVGMDVVKTNIERIGGTVELQSEVGKGTTITIKLQPRLAERCT